MKLLSYAAPLILTDWQVSKIAFAPTLAAALVGMAFGAYAGGILGDRYGRRIVAVVSILGFGLATAACGFTTDIWSLTLLRFISGLGFGSVTPNAFALLVEWLPERYRGKGVGLLSAGSPAGGLVGALVALALLPNYGWRSCFVIVGAATAVLGVIMWFLLPESPGYLMARGRLAELEKSRARFGTDAGPIESLTPVTEPRENVSRTIYTRELLRLNIGGSLSFFSAHFINYGVASWLPVILTSAGLKITDAITGSLLYSVSAIAASIGLGGLMRRVGSRAMLVGCAFLITALLGALAVGLNVGAAGPGPYEKAYLLIIISLIGAVSGTTLMVVTTVMSVGYPIERRATGVGLGVTAGRVGGIATTLLGGFLLSIRANDATPLLATLAFLGLAMLFAAYVIDRHITS